MNPFQRINIFLLPVFIVTMCSLVCAEVSGDGLRIRSIQVEVREVFDEGALGSFYRTVNSLKTNTRKEIVRRELLFEVGENYDSFLVEESERNLRTLSFLRQVSITPVVDGDEVDVIVSVQDVWTLFPQIGLDLGGGKDKKSIGVSEGNLLGYGKRAELLYADDEGREKVEGVWDDNRLLGTYQRLLLGHFERSDGFRSVGFYGRPFRSLVEPEAWAVNVEAFDLVERLFANGDERFIFRQRHTSLGGSYTFSRGDPEVLLRRFSVGYEYTKDRFREADEDDFFDVDVDSDSVSRDPALLASDRTFSGPFVGYQQIEPDFLSINYVDRFERIQDFNLGREMRAKLGFAGDSFGSEEDTLLVSLSGSGGVRATPTSFIRSSIGGTARYNNDGLDNALLFTDVKYYNILGSQSFLGQNIGKHTVASSFSLDYGKDFDRDRELLLGAGTGLRGYDIRTFTGDKRVVFNLEDRFHLADDLFQLVSIGGVVFYDVGGTTNKNLGDILTSNLYQNVGLGFRFGFTRSSGTSVLRIDFAFPLRDGPDGSEALSPRVLITIGQAFRSDLRQVSLGPTPASITVGEGD